MVILAACSSRPPCEEPVEGPPGDVSEIGSSLIAEQDNAKYVHLVTFEMGPITESLEGYMIVRRTTASSAGPDALRVYGMSETGQEAFDVALMKGLVAHIYRAPFLKDDRLLDQIALATAKIFLMRPPVSWTGSWGAGGGWTVECSDERTDEGHVLARGGVRWCFSGPDLHLRWLQGKDYYACFMGWSTKTGVYAPERIHFHSDEGPYPYDLTMKLVSAKALDAPPPDSLFEAPR